MDSIESYPLHTKRGPNRPCKISGCSRPVGYKGARGWCSKHYQRWMKTGHPLGSNKPSAESRFFAKVRQLGDCWIWVASKDQSGYGMFSDANSRSKSAHTHIERAHRWSYTFLRAEIPDGLQLDHLCRNRACVNPWHLEPVTHLVNWERGISPWRLNDLKDECLQGHPFTPDNTYHHPQGSRVCRACMAKHRQAYEQRQAEKRRAA